jgi:hypothetical protein
MAQIEKNQARQDTRARATLRLGQFQDQVLALAESWHITARNVGSAYKLAADRHATALAEQAKHDALMVQIAFSVLTIVASGALSWLSSVTQARAESRLDYAKWKLDRAEKLNRGLAVRVPLANRVKRLEVLPEVQMLTEAVEDAAQAGAGEALSAVGPMVVSPKSQSVSEDPQIFQNDRENVVSEAKTRVFEHFGKIKAKWASAPLDAWDTYNDDIHLAAHKLWLADAFELAGKDDVPGVETIANEIERGIWAKWMPKLRYQDFNHPQYTSDTRYKSIGSDIEDRLHELGILRMADVSIHWYHTAKSEDTKLIAWGAGYKVRDFASLKEFEGIWPKFTPKKPATPKP